jgi:6-phosphofructokinase 1
MEKNLEGLSEAQKLLVNCNLSIKKLGTCIYDSDLRNYSDHGSESHFVPEDERILAQIDKSEINKFISHNLEAPSFEKAGPKKKLYFEPGSTISAIVTCGGLCPGLNSVIRSIVMMNFYRYNNQITYGIRYGYAGFIKENSYDVQLLTPELVAGINTLGGTILGSSRGNQDTVKIVDRLVELNVKVLYAIGGDGTLRGAMDIEKEIDKRGLKIAVIGIPKTIDNDVSFIDKSFGMETAFSEACNSIYAAHTEATAAANGIGIVKLMGRESGFIAANATLATSDVNFCLIPELDFDLEGKSGFLPQLEKRLVRRKHAVIVVAEGAGQQYVSDSKNPNYDPSGNVKLGDIGLYLKDKIKDYLKKKNIPTSIKYLDPSYSIRSRAPTPNDSIFCSQLAQMAVHAGMSGRTGLVVGYLNGHFTHVPMELATSRRKKIEPYSQLWLSVLEATGQPLTFKNE